MKKGIINCIVKMQLLVILLFFSIQLKAQKYDPGNIIPPSPNASSLGKFGGIDPSLSSGSVNINIPLYNYNAGKLTVPISLGYISSGFKVDEIASRVGAQTTSRCPLLAKTEMTPFGFYNQLVRIRF